MKTDYKFWYITRNDDGFIIECAIRYYEGDVTTENERDVVSDILVPVTRYRRSKRLQGEDLPHLSDKNTILEESGVKAILYNQKDFGQIKTDDELRVFLNGELRKDVNRTPIDEQKVR